MKKTILITGSTDGIGLAAAKTLYSQGHHILLHGRSQTKLESAKEELKAAGGNGEAQGFLADLSQLSDVERLANSVPETIGRLDVLINNAGVLSVADSSTSVGLDIRFLVNTIAPFLLTRKLRPLLGNHGRVISLSSAAQSPVNLQALERRIQLSDMEAYAQSKLALTMWTRHLAQTAGDNGPAFIAVNPGSLLGTKMVQQGFGVSGKDIGIGADILARAAVSEEFSNASGLYFDNDVGKFSSPHSDALDAEKCASLAQRIETTLSKLNHSEN
ncbi:SDR family NAD(P)-dependent oxidoreductase [Pelagicoccus sp. SDUM812005]|uniref:SDR family NAD(P)-dependent oxidoreductase n=1 Tax=Pelagicoccus sp. SDUM812005 TaxID=3041257 RepID=UPI00280D6EB0|nr:SDR family NAD(P)-dependent oxidoreductase [Pelagicoccus sp. SDUM812005]MDQ8183691.1 SDR family NAD(P)-dependent oxidoreductase [Pelagicoccus sp. SDUM812005]